MARTRAEDSDHSYPLQQAGPSGRVPSPHPGKGSMGQVPSDTLSADTQQSHPGLAALPSPRGLQLPLQVTPRSLPCPEPQPRHASLTLPGLSSGGVGVDSRTGSTSSLCLAWALAPNLNGLHHQECTPVSCSPAINSSTWAHGPLTSLTPPTPPRHCSMHTRAPPTQSPCGTAAPAQTLRALPTAHTRLCLPRKELGTTHLPDLCDKSENSLM